MKYGPTCLGFRSPWCARRSSGIAPRIVFGVALTLLLTVGVTSASDISAYAQTNPITWSADAAVMPADADPGTGGGFNTLSCPAAGWCVATGQYDNAVGTEGMIITESSDGFSSIQAPLPADASTTDPNVYPNNESCPDVGDCVILGTYTNTSSDTSLFVDTLSSGVWTTSVLPLPSNATAENFNYELDYSSLSCSAPGMCTAVGQYTTATTDQSWIETDSGGSWSVEEAPSPSNGTGTSGLFDLSCPDASDCVAVGTYQVASDWQSFADTLSGGTWSAAELPVPSDANGLGVGDAYSLGNGFHNPPWTVSCPAVGSCAVAGHYYSTADEGQPLNVEADLLDTLSGGSWISQAAPLPADAVVPVPITDSYLTLACSSPGSCVATGFYEVQPASAQFDLGFADTLAGGTWTSAQFPVPTGISGDGEMYPSAVACPADGACVVAGTGGGNGESAFYENESGGSWVATQAPLPGIDLSTGPQVYITNLSCPAAGACSNAVTAIDQTTADATMFFETDPSRPSTSTSIAVNPPDPKSGESVTLTAMVTANSSTPTGTVSFWSGSDSLCSATLSAGTASCSVTSWPSGPFSVGASYSGSSSLAPSSTSRPFRIKTTSLPPGSPTVAYDAAISVEGGNAPYEFSILYGKLPTGLSLNPYTGLISGKPRQTDIGTSRFTVAVFATNTTAILHNPYSQTVAFKTLSIQVGIP
jgi:Bacterial Ig-like domain (group 3)